MYRDNLRGRNPKRGHEEKIRMVNTMRRKEFYWHFS
jgi:hypothetical protein